MIRNFEPNYVTFAMKCKACPSLSSGVLCPFKLCPLRVGGSKTLFFSVDIAFAPFLSIEMLLKEWLHDQIDDSPKGNHKSVHETQTKTDDKKHKREKER